MAVPPLAVRYCTVMAPALPPLRVTNTTPLGLLSPTRKFAAVKPREPTLSTMVSTALLMFRNAPPLGFDSRRPTVSAGSGRLSLTMGTVKVRLVTPGVKTKTALVAI